MENSPKDAGRGSDEGAQREGEGDGAPRRRRGEENAPTTPKHGELSLLCFCRLKWERINSRAPTAAGFAQSHARGLKTLHLDFLSQRINQSVSHLLVVKL